jgi:prepilin-type N-terminal cleavage/methylation domain-containing protein
MKNGKNAFTLIELILTISISLILLWQGLVRYNEFNRKQQVRQAALDFVSVLRNAQNRAITGDKPMGGCTKFEGYQVSPALSSNRYSVGAVCDSGILVGSQNGKLRTSLVSFSSGAPITFNSLYGTSNGGSFTLRHTVVNTITATITVSAGGDISCNGCK